MTVHRGVFIVPTLYCLSGPLIWSMHFGGLYGVQHVLCAKTASYMHSYYELFAWAFTALSLLLLGWSQRHFSKRVAKQNADFATSVLLDAGDAANRSFLRRVALLSAGLSALAILWEFAAVLVLPEC